MKTYEIHAAILPTVEANEKHKKYSAELSKHYRHLKSVLPQNLRNVLDEFYLSTIGIETVVMETAFHAGRNHSIKAAAKND